MQCNQFWKLRVPVRLRNRVRFRRQAEGLLFSVLIAIVCEGVVVAMVCEGNLSPCSPVPLNKKLKINLLPDLICCLFV
jgi:hypothetical protein